MSAGMDLGPLVAVMRLDDDQFEQRMRRAVNTSETTAKAVQKALDRLTLTVDDRRFADALRTAPDQAVRATQRISRAFDDVGQAADQSARRVGQAADQQARSLSGTGDATKPLVRALGEVGSTAEQTANRIRRSSDQSSEAVRGTGAEAQRAARAQADLERALQGIASTLDKQSGAVTDNTRAWAANKIGADQLRSLEQLGVNTREYVDAVVGVPGALQRMNVALDGQGDSLQRLNALTSQVSQAQGDFQLRQRAIGESTQGAASEVHRAAGLIDRAGDASGRATPLVGGLGQAFDKARTAMIALFAASTFIDFIRDSVRAASDLEQAGGSVTAVFGDMSKGIEEFGQTSAETIGIAKGEYQQMAAIFGAQLKNMGVSAAELVPMTNKLVTLGADLAAQYGGSTSDAVEALGALLRGEADPIERYAVGIKKADINARLAAEGMDGLTGAAGKNAELQATLAILWEQTASAQGAFGRETDTLAVQQQKANARFEEAKAQIGDKLLPVWSQFTLLLKDDGIPAIEAIGGVFADLLGIVGPVVGFFADLPGPVQAAAVALGLVVVLNGPLQRTGATLAALAVGAGRSATQIAAGMTRVGFAAKTALAVLGGPLGAAILGIVTVMSLMGGETDDTTASVEGLAAAVDDATGKFKDNAKEVAINEVVSSGLAQQYAAMGGNLEDLVLALLGNEAAQNRVNAAAAEYEKYAKTNEDVELYKQFTAGYSQGLGTIADAQEKGTLKAKLNEDAQAQLAKVQGESGDAASESAAKWDDLSDAQKNATDSAKFVSEKLKDAAEQAKILADNTEAAQMLAAFKDKADDAARAADLFKIKLDELDGRSRSLDDATADQQATLAALKKSFEEGTKAATENTEAGNLNTDAIEEWNVKALNATSDGRALYAELNNMADQHAATAAAAYNDAVAQGDSAGAMDKARQAATDGRQAFVDLASQYLGGNVPAAEALADKLGIVDGQKIDDKFFQVVGDDKQAQDAVDRANASVVNDKLFQIRADAVDALVQAQNLNETLSKIDGKEVRWFAIGNVVVSVSQQDLDDANAKAANFGYAPTDYSQKAAGGWIGLAGGGFSNGMSGWVRGPGGPTDDLVVAQGPNGAQVRVSPDEFVTRAAIATQTGPFLEALNAGDPLAMSLAGVIKRAGGGWISRAGGGAVGTSSAGTAPAEQAATAVAALPEMVPDAEAIGTAWDQIVSSITAAWESGLLPVFDELDARSVAMGAGQGALAAGFGTQWAIISTAVQVNRAMIGGEFDALNAGTLGVQGQTATSGAAIGATWQGTAAAIQAAVQGSMLPTMSLANQAAAGVQAAHEAAARGVIAAWAGIKAGVAEPVNWVLQNVWNQGVLPAWEQIRGWLPSIDVTMGPLPAVKFAKGGVFGGRGGTFPGFSPGNDTITAQYSPGEGVVVPEAVQGLGGPAAIQAINERFAGHRIGRSMSVGARDPRFFAGGVWDKVPSVSVGAPESDGKVEPAPADQLSFVKGFAFDAFDTITHLMRGSLAGTQELAEGSPWGRANSNLAANTVGALLGTLKTMFGLENDGKGGNPVVPGMVTMDGVLLVSSEGKTYAVPKPEGARGAAMEAVASQMGTSYVWGAAGPNVFDCSGLMSWALAQAGINRGRLTADAFHQSMPHVTVGKPGDMPTYSARYSKESGMAGHIGMILDPAQDLMMHTDGAGPARVQAGYKSREGGPLSIVDAIGGAVNATGKGVGELPAILARAIYGDYSTAASAAGAIDPARAGDLSAWESTRTLNTVDPIQDFGPMNMARGTLAQVGPIPPGDPVNRWAPMYASLLAMKGKPASALANILGQEKSESGGDPLAYNNTDRNFFAGHPSKSLLQTIPSTFRANAEPGFNTNIWHPPSNGLAAINYVDKNYGGVFPLRAYDSGGAFRTGTIGANLSGMTEEVLTGPERSAWVADVRQRKAEKEAARQSWSAPQQQAQQSRSMPLLHVERMEIMRGTPEDIVDEMLWRAKR